MSPRSLVLGSDSWSAKDDKFTLRTFCQRHNISILHIISSEKEQIVSDQTQAKHKTHSQKGIDIYLCHMLIARYILLLITHTLKMMDYMD